MKEKKKAGEGDGDEGEVVMTMKGSMAILIEC
jgi:hypothetical protein